MRNHLLVVLCSVVAFVAGCASSKQAAATTQPEEKLPVMVVFDREKPVVAYVNSNHGLDDGRWIIEKKHNSNTLRYVIVRCLQTGELRIVPTWTDDHNVGDVVYIGSRNLEIQVGKEHGLIGKLYFISYISGFTERAESK